MRLINLQGLGIEVDGLLILLKMLADYGQIVEYIWLQGIGQVSLNKRLAKGKFIVDVIVVDTLSEVLFSFQEVLHVHVGQPDIVQHPNYLLTYGDTWLYSDCYFFSMK